jgi:hypothetical protein
VKIECGGESVEIYKTPFNLDAGQTQQVPIQNVLSRSIIGNVKGNNCVLKADYGSESGTSQTFQISDKININLDSPLGRYNPKESIQIKGEALKANGQKVNGFIEARLGSSGANVVNFVRSLDPTPDDPVKLLNIFAPAGFEGYVRELAERAQAGDLDEAGITEIASKYDFRPV